MSSIELLWSTAIINAAMRVQLLPLEAAPARVTVNCEKFIVRGSLTGPNGRALKELSIWMREETASLTKFITLYPDLT